MRSLFISLLVSFFTVVLAYPIAYFISFHGGSHKSLWLFLITIPFWTSYLLRVMSWKVILGYSGVLNSGLMGLGIIDEPSTAFLYNTSAVVITLTHAWAAFAILPIFVSLEKVDRTLIEAATDLGDGPVRRFLRVTLPLSMPGVISALLIVMIPTVGDYVTPRLVGGKDGVMIANAIQAQFGKAANWPLGAALSVTTMVIVTRHGRRRPSSSCAGRRGWRDDGRAQAPDQLAAGSTRCSTSSSSICRSCSCRSSPSTPRPCPNSRSPGFTLEMVREPAAHAGAARRGLEQPRRRRRPRPCSSTLLGICAARAITRYRFPGQRADQAA